MNTRWVPLLILLICPALLHAQATQKTSDKAVENERHIFSRSRFVHRINLWDEDGRNITLKDPNPKPYSPMMTCSRCHPTATISHGWHFNATDPAIKPGRAGEPWLYFEATTRSVLPLSYRNWKGTYRPEQVGLSTWQFIDKFGRHLPGGGPGMMNENKSPEDKWKFSGRFEVNCMICHMADTSHDPADRAKLLENQHLFKWTPSVALGLAKVDLQEEEEEGDDAKADKPAKVKMVYDKSRFDFEERVFFATIRQPPASRCYYCHTNFRVDPRAGSRWEHDGDVHIRKGLFCTDCHRNGLDHNISRGYETEWKDRNDPAISTLTCKGCHIGSSDSTSPTGSLGGRLAAPKPAHRGLPPLHFDKISCTGCHSGQFPRESPEWMQTSMAHKLGTERPERHPETFPRIVEPVYLKNDTDGKIAPHRMVWPSFFGRLVKDEAKPIAPDQVKKMLSGALPAVRETQYPEATKALSDEQISAALATIAAKDKSTDPIVYIASGKMYRRSADGKLSITEHASASPYAWAIAHDVRPASQSLGVRGCQDCHSNTGPMFFGNVTALGPVDPSHAADKQMLAFRGEDASLQRFWAKGFEGRALMKAVVLTCAGIVACVLLSYGVRALAGAFGGQGKY